MMRRALLLPPFLLLAFSLSGVLAREVPAPEVITSPIPTASALNATGEDASTAAAVANHTWPSLEQLQLCGYAPLPGVGAEASGVAYMPPTDTWWVVSPVPRPALHELSGWPALRPLRALPLGPQVNDPEGVTWLGGSLLAVVNEDGGQVIEVDTAKADGLYMRVLAAPLDVAQEDNKGFEGIAAGLQPNEIYLAQQDMPRRVIKLDVATGTGEELFDLDADLPSKQGKGIKKGKKRERTPLQETASKLKELSDLVVAPSGLLYILSQASKTVALVTPEGRLLQHKEVDLPRPEGLAFKADGSAMMVVSEGQVPTAPSTMAYFAVNCSAV
ncbi:SdiA-regulated-domain-containing protein [Haematococcus lacustris]